MRPRKERNVGLRRGSVRDCAGAQRAAASGRNVGQRWGAACSCAGVQQGAVLGRGVGLRWAYVGWRKGPRVLP